MKAVVWKAVCELSVEDVPDAELETATDVLLRVTSSAICGTDLHIYEGRLGEPTGMVIGHEPLGVVEAVGSAVVNVRPGDRVVVPTHICCGFCPSCAVGHNAECLINNPGSAGAAYGYPNMGDFRGAQAELVRVPFGDANCLRLPGDAGDDFEHDFVLLADALPTGYHATELAGVSAGDSVVIFGAGSVGLLSAMCARLRGAADVYVVDYIPDRLEKAGELGCEPIDFTVADPVEQIREHRQRLRASRRAYRAEGPLEGVTCGIDAIGFQARAREDPSREDPHWVIQALAQLIQPGGRLGIIGVFVDSDPHAVGEPESHGNFPIPWGPLFKKGVRIGMGRDEDKLYNRRLRDLITTGQLRPSQVVSHRLAIEQAPDAFRRFDQRSDGYLKVILSPDGS